MATMRYESGPDPSHEVELSVSLDEARQEVIDTVESIILVSLGRAKKLPIGGTDKLWDTIAAKQDVSPDSQSALSKRSSRLIDVIKELREQSEVLASGIIENATNEELVKLVDQLEKFNHAWKNYVGDENLVADTDSLIGLLENVAAVLTRKTLIIEIKTSTLPEKVERKSLLSPDALEKLKIR
jgi:hypothetical protein